MGRLYDAVQRIDAMIEREGLDVFKTRGQISLKAGFFIAIVAPTDPDDSAKLESLRAAVVEVLGEPLDV